MAFNPTTTFEPCQYGSSSDIELCTQIEKAQLRQEEMHEYYYNLEKSEVHDPMQATLSNVESILNNSKDTLTDISQNTLGLADSISAPILTGLENVVSFLFSVLLLWMVYKLVTTLFRRSLS